MLTKNSVEVINGHIVLFRPSGGKYPIELSRCNDLEKIVSWVQHLDEKSWVTKEHIGDFVRLAISENNIPFNHGLF